MKFFATIVRSDEVEAAAHLTDIIANDPMSRPEDIKAMTVLNKFVQRLKMMES